MAAIFGVLKIILKFIIGCRFPEHKTIPMYFFNGMKYDNSIILKSICDIFKNNVTLNVIGNSCESFKMIDFKFKK